MKWEKANDIKIRIKHIIGKIDLKYIDSAKIVCFRSTGSTSRARARIWGFPRVWQLALNLSPHYVIEVISKSFDHLSQDDQDRILIHELMHIPKNFSGSLLSHRTKYGRIDSRSVEKLYRQFVKNS